MPPRPLALTDAELDAVMAACQPLHPSQRDAFLQHVASLLRDCGEIGPGAVHRAIVAAQRAHFDPPDLSHEHAPRWSSRRRNGVRGSADC
jgi:hypothetical protein